MRAAEIMTPHVLTVSPDATADDARQTMRSERIHHLLVGSLSRPVGIISARDLGGRTASSRRRTVRELMSAPVVTVDVEDPVRRIANVMRGRTIGCVIVTAKHRVVGIITVSDLLELLGRGADRPLSRADRRGLHHRVPHRRASMPSGLW